jgi:hypothetical protein
MQVQEAANPSLAPQAQAAKSKTGRFGAQTPNAQIGQCGAEIEPRFWKGSSERMSACIFCIWPFLFSSAFLQTVLFGSKMMT